MNNKWIVRQLIRETNVIFTNALSEETSPADLLDDAAARILSLSMGSEQEVTHSAEEVMTKVVGEVREKAGSEHKLLGLTTGLRDLDQQTGGYEKTDLIIIAARPSMGKSALAFGTAVSACLEDKATVVLCFSLEMSAEQLVMRMICSEAKVDINRFRTAWLNREEWARIAEAVNSLQGVKIFIDDRPGLNAIQIRAKARRVLAAQKRLDLIIVDYLQLMTSAKTRAQEEHQTVSDNSRALKGLAKELKVPVVALSQLSRGPESRNPPKPMLSDLRSSGAIEQDADKVFLIYRDEYYKPTEENAGIAEIIVAKQRSGPTGTVRLAFLREFAKFANYYGELPTDN